jgi:hypothetical protein
MGGSNVTRTARSLAGIATAFFFLACASGGGGSAPAADSTATPAEKSSYSDAPAGSELAKVELGMNDAEVRKLLGDPDDSNAYMTGKAFIPFYYGPDTHRSDWMYKGKGRVVFSRNRWSGSMKVIRVMSNPNE